MARLGGAAVPFLLLLLLQSAAAKSPPAISEDFVVYTTEVDDTENGTVILKQRIVRGRLLRHAFSCIP